MFQVSYAGATFLTGAALGEALLRYARALALKDRADTIKIPGLLDDGSPTEVDLLIGPASQIVILEVQSEGQEPEDQAIVAELDRRLVLLDAPNALPVADAAEQLPPDLEYT
jgi:hypothetical protein